MKRKHKFNPKKYIDANYIENGKVDIAIGIKEKANFYDELDIKKLTLSKSIVDYIDSKLKNVIYKKSVVLKFYTPSLSDEEQEDITKLIRAYYGLILFQNKRELNFDKIKVFMLFFIGIIFLLTTYILSSKLLLIKDILSIAGWVSIWEMINTILFDTIRAQRERYNYSRLYNADIKFITE